jgi:hypothetical protein
MRGKMCDCGRKVLEQAVDGSDKNDKKHMLTHLRFLALHFRNACSVLSRQIETECKTKNPGGFPPGPSPFKTTLTRSGIEIPVDAEAERPVVRIDLRDLAEIRRDG